MSQKGKHEHGDACAAAAAMLVPLCQAASRASWAAVLAVGAGLLVLGWGLVKYTEAPPFWVAALQRIWVCLIVSELLHWSSACWPDHRDSIGASLILLGLAVWLARDGRQRTKRGVCTLIWPVGLILGMVFLAALPEIRAEDLVLTWHMREGHLITLMIAGMLHGRERNREGERGILCAWIAGLAAAVVTGGVLSLGVSGSVVSPVYELSRSIGLFGVVERFESITAAAMTLGYFAAIAYLLSADEKNGESVSIVWIYGAAAAGIYLTNIRVDSRILTIGCIVVWVILPVLCSLGKIFRKIQKSS